MSAEANITVEIYNEIENITVEIDNLIDEVTIEVEEVDETITVEVYDCLPQAPESDPIFQAWLTTNPLQNFITEETDPVFQAWLDNEYQQEVLQFENLLAIQTAFPIGTEGVIYVATNSLTTDIPEYYIWNGVAYITTPAPITGVTGSGIINRLTKWNTPTTVTHSNFVDYGVSGAYLGGTQWIEFIPSSGCVFRVARAQSKIDFGLGVSGAFESEIHSTQQTEGLNLWSEGDLQFSTGSVGGLGFIPFKRVNINKITGNVHIGGGITPGSERLQVTGNLRVTGAYVDSVNNVGTLNQVLVSTVTGTQWSTINTHYRGKYTSLANLQAAVPIGNDGDCAIVDAGIGTNAVEYIWDANEGWVLGNSTGASSTDALPEGVTNLYFTNARAVAALAGSLALKKNISTGNNYKWETTDASGNLQETTVTANRAVATDANGLPVASVATKTELDLLTGLSSNAQGQFNQRAIWLIDSVGGPVVSVGALDTIVYTLPITAAMLANTTVGELNFAIEKAAAATSLSIAMHASTSNVTLGNRFAQYNNSSTSRLTFDFERRFKISSNLLDPMKFPVGTGALTNIGAVATGGTPTTIAFDPTVLMYIHVVASNNSVAGNVQVLSSTLKYIR